MMSLSRLVRRLSTETRGAATIEFALWGSMFFVAMLTALDFGMWRTYQLRLGSAVEQGAIMAFNGRATLDQTAANAIRTYVGTAAHLPAPGIVTVTAGCNGGANNCVATSRQCACLATTAGTNSFTAATCGSACTGGSTAGYYMTVKASYPYSAVVLPQTLLSGKTLSEGVTVRLQ